MMAWHEQDAYADEMASEMQPQSDGEAYPSRSEMATTLMPRRVGESIPFWAHTHDFEVKRLSKTTWHLRRLDIASRSRFGTFSEIRSDVMAALESGCLPGGDKGRW